MRPSFEISLFGTFYDQGGDHLIYFIHGPDRFLARQAAMALAAELDPAGTNTSWIDGREMPVDLIATAVGTASIFGSPRVTIVSDLLGRIKIGNDSESGDSASAASSTSRPNPNVSLLLGSVPGDDCLILLEPNLTAAPSVIKTAGKSITTIAGEPPRGNALLAWIADAARDAHSSIDLRSAQLLAELVFPQTWNKKPTNPRFDRPPDLTQLAQEIEKLALRAHPGPIDHEHIRELVPTGPDQRVFRFLDATLAGDLRSALTELERLEAAGEEPAVLLAQFHGQVELTTVAGAAASRDPAALARDLGSVTPARMSAVLAFTNRQPARAGVATVLAVAVDRNLKTGRIRQPTEALLHAVLAMASGVPGHTNSRPQ